MSAFSREESEELLALLEEVEYRNSRRKFYSWFPAEGPFARELYPRHMLFFSAGRDYHTRCFMAANRIGKTTSNAFEITCHLTGEYPDWWNGARYSQPVDVWMAGKTIETTRDILQTAMFGEHEALGTGMIPADLIARRPKYRTNSGGAIDYAYIRHVPTGGLSKIGFKSYDQRRKAFEGTAKHIIGLDEEAPEDIRNECLIRLGTTSGHLIETFTPLDGRTKVVELYMGPGARVSEKHGVYLREGRVMVQAGWDHVPHLTEEDKARMLRETPEYLREARSKGIPSLGSGAIYPVPEADIKVKDFPIPAHWPRVYALDVGWNRTAALWGAYDREQDVVYLYSEHYRGQAEPLIHAAAIRARGEWIPGVIDPAARGRTQDAGKQLLKMYKDNGLILKPADNSLEAGIYQCWQRLSLGKMKVFASCQNFFAEYRVYRRDEKGKIVEGDDHLMDTMRYLVMSGLKIAAQPPAGHANAGPGWSPLDPVIGH